MSILNKIKNFIGFELPDFELSEEREEEIIENIIKRAKDYSLVMPLEFLLYGLEPISTVVSSFTLLPVAPFLEVFGLKGYEYSAFLMKKENVRRLRDRLDNLREQ